MQHHSEVQDLEDYLDHVGNLEGAPERVIDQAKRYGRTLLFHVKPALRCLPNDAKDKAAAYLRRRTCRVQD